MESQGGQGPSAQQGENSSPVGPSPSLESSFRPIANLLQTCQDFRKEVYESASKHLKFGSLESKVSILSSQLEEAKRETERATAAATARVPLPPPSGPFPTDLSGAQVQQPPGPPLEPAAQGTGRGVTPSRGQARPSAARSVGGSDASSERKADRSRSGGRRSRRRSKSTRRKRDRHHSSPSCSSPSKSRSHRRGRSKPARWKGRNSRSEEEKRREKKQRSKPPRPSSARGERRREANRGNSARPCLPKMLGISECKQPRCLSRQWR